MQQFLVYSIRFERILQTHSENSENLGNNLLYYDLSSEAWKKHFYRLENLTKLPFFFPPLFQNIMDKSLGALLRFWGVFQFTQVQPLPSPHKQCWTRVSRIFSEFQLCIGWGRENCKKISKRMHCFKREPRNDRKIWILQYCPKDFCPWL